MAKMRYQNLEYEQETKFPYCECCGLKNTEIFKKLIKAKISITQPTKVKVKLWKTHELRQTYLYEHKTNKIVYIDWFEDSFQAHDEIKYCAKCGILLDHEDHKSTWGSYYVQPEYLGYKCHGCGYEYKE